MRFLSQWPELSRRKPKLNFAIMALSLNMILTKILNLKKKEKKKS